MAKPLNSSEMFTFVGVETAGKTTVSNELAQKLGGQALRVPTWPSLDKFLTSPEAHALANQEEAMEYTLKAKYDALDSQLQPLLADSSPDRIHLVHSWRLKEEGLLSNSDWEKLQGQYDEAREQWGSHYVYLRVGLPTITRRLEERGRPEDLEYNLQAAATFLERWENIIADNQWREGRKILEVNGEVSLDEVCDTTELWIRKQINDGRR